MSSLQLIFSYEICEQKDFVVKIAFTKFVPYRCKGEANAIQSIETIINTFRIYLSVVVLDQKLQWNT